MFIVCVSECSHVHKQQRNNSPLMILKDLLMSQSSNLTKLVFSYIGFVTFRHCTILQKLVFSYTVIQGS